MRLQDTLNKRQCYMALVTSLKKEVGLNDNDGWNQRKRKGGIYLA